MFESIINFFKKIGKQDKEQVKSKDAAKERLHLVLMQDRANVSADFLDLMKQEIIEVIKKYIDVDENAIDVRLTNKENEDGTKGAPALYANIPIVSIKEEVKTGMARQKDTSKEKSKTSEKVVDKKETIDDREKQPTKKEKGKEESKHTESKKQEVEESKKEVSNEEPKNKEAKQENKDEQKEKKEEVKKHKQQEEPKQADEIKEKPEEKEKTKKENTTKK